MLNIYINFVLVSLYTHILHINPKKNELLNYGKQQTFN